MKSHRPLLLLMSLLLAIALPAFADEPLKSDDSKKEAKVADMSLEELLATFVTSASKLSQLTTEAPAEVSLIPDYAIQGFGWTSINAVLYAQPGFAPSQDYDRRTVSSRGVFEGWNNNHLLMLIDGIPFNDNLYGTAFTSEITPLFFTRSLEILRGPGSALYGSNAMNGTVSIKTVSASDLADSVTGTVRFGDFGTRSYDVIGGWSGKVADVVAGYNWQTTDGNEYSSLDGSRRTNADGTLASFRTHDHRSSDYFFGKLECHGVLQGLTLQVHRQGWEFGTGQGWIFYIPDFDEAMREVRTIASASYRRKDARGWEYELAGHYQQHEINWNQRYYPNDTTDPYGDVYPAGLWEYLHTSADDYFGRAQATIPMARGSTLVTGLESTEFRYDGDREHFSNVNINYGGDYQPFPGDRSQPLRPWLEWIRGNPILNLAGYGQFSSGSILGSTLEATLGLRYDRQSFRLNSLDKAGEPKESQAFSQWSPRFALVYKPGTAWTFKFLGSRAFRAPAPTEMFGANTYSLASNPRQLQPEFLTSTAVTAEWRVSNDFLLRANAFRNHFHNQIAYSTANANLSTNVYSLQSAGLELETLFGSPQDFGFFNYSYARRIGEQIIDPTVALSAHRLTWYPANVANLGFLHNAGRWQGSVSAHFQGATDRRASDVLDPQFLPYRPSSVHSWTSLDGNFFYRPANRLEFGFAGTNLLNKRNRTLIKTNDFPFDYLIEGRRWTVTARLLI